jgi:uncharacterized membrane protein
MNDESHDFDPRLAQLFAREHAHLPPEPFSSAALRRIAEQRKRSALKTRVLQAAAVIALVVLSPVLMNVSSWLATRLDSVLALASAWLASPLMLAATVLLALAAIVTKWARIW